MNIWSLLGLPTFGAALALAMTSSYGCSATGDEDSPVAGDSTVVVSFDLTEQSPDDRVPQSHGVSAEALAAARERTFQVTGFGCTEAQFGTAFVAAKGKLVTNAHVVAGIKTPLVTLGDREVAARVVAFDPVSDLAVLTVDEFLPDPLPLEEATPGAVVALLGYDRSGSVVVRPARVFQAILATGKDIYGKPAEGRRALMVDARVDTGFSGGPIVGPAGAVVGVVFSRARGGSPVAYAIQTGEVLDLLDKAGVGPEGSGPCP